MALSSYFCRFDLKKKQAGHKRDKKHRARGCQNIKDISHSGSQIWPARSREDAHKTVLDINRYAQHMLGSQRSVGAAVHQSSRCSCTPTPKKPTGNHPIPSGPGIKPPKVSTSRSMLAIRLCTVACWFWRPATDRSGLTLDRRVIKATVRVKLAYDTTKRIICAMRLEEHEEQRGNA